MATLSVRQVTQNCLGVSGRISVNTDVYGYVFRDTDGSVFGTLRSNDTLPGSGQPTARSLKRHLQTMSGEAADLAVILVGHENDFSGEVTRDQVTKTQYAIQVTRDIYAQVDLGVRRISWQRISKADAGNYVDITDSGEAQDLTDDWSGRGGGIDVFMVRSIGNASGWSDVRGPCGGKESKFDLSGAVVEMSGGRRSTGIVLAHEVGHWLGLVHSNTITNLMGTDVNGDGIGETDNTSTNLTGSQGTRMRSSCWVNGPC